MRIRSAVLAILCIGLVCCVSSMSNQVYAQGKAAMPRITVLNPLGTPPPIQIKPMAPRMETMDGKTIYIVNTGYVNTERLVDEFVAWFKTNYPKTNIVLSRAGMDNISQQLLTEIGQKADGVIVALGH